MSINTQDHSSLSSSGLEQFASKVQRRLALVPLVVWQGLLRGLLVVWLAVVLAQILWSIIPRPKIPPAVISADTTSVVQQAAANTTSSHLDIDQLKALTPFGQQLVTETAPIEEKDIGHDAVDTQLNLVLRGLVYSNDESKARAVIAVSDKQDVYAPGDTLPISNNVKLAKVFPEKVIIDNNGRFESLWLFKDDPNAPPMSSALTNPSIDNYSRQAPVTFEQADIGQLPVAPSSDPTQALTTLSDVVAMTIHREQGEIVGYKIRPGRNAALFTSLGLQTDDVVTAVNGTPLNNPSKIMEVYRSLGTATSANLEILRNGGRINLDISLR